MKEPRGDIDPELSKAIVSTISEPLVILDDHQKVLIANPAFYAKFRVEASDTEDKSFYTLGNGQWDIPQLRKLLEDILPKKNGSRGIRGRS